MSSVLIVRINLHTAKWYSLILRLLINSIHSTLNLITLTTRFKKLERKKSRLRVNIALRGPVRSFSKRFYKKIFKYRYSRNYAIQSKGILVSPVTAAISSTRLANNGYKPYFHLKTIFNLNEFLMYDFYNFHSKQISGKFLNNSKLSKVWTTKIWKKINFFYYIRYSMDVARTNMLKFFKIRFRTGSKVTQFFAGFNSLTPINYIWFFEFSIPYLLVKLRYAESMTQGILYAHSNVVWVNNCPITSRLAIIKPGDYLNLTISSFLILKMSRSVIFFFKFLKKTRRFLKRTILKPRRFRVKLPGIQAKAQYLNLTKQYNFIYIESDYKSLSTALLPVNSPEHYINSFTLLWSNFWNYRIMNWKFIV